jgi:transcription termination factor NusB
VGSGVLWSFLRRYSFFPDLVVEKHEQLSEQIGKYPTDGRTMKYDEHINQPVLTLYVYIYSYQDDFKPDTHFFKSPVRMATAPKN